MRSASSCARVANRHYNLCHHRLFYHRYVNTQTNIMYKYHKRWSNFKSSIQTESVNKSGSGINNYSRILFSSLIGSIFFFGLGNKKIQLSLSQFINDKFVLDYFAVKETYRYYIDDDLTNWPQTNPTKRLCAILINSFCVGFVVGIIRSQIIVKIGMVLTMAMLYNEQSPGYMIMGLRAIYINNNDNNDNNNDNYNKNINEWRARMDYYNFIRRQFAFYPIELLIYIACLGALGPASILSAIAWGTHIIQFYGDSNRTWLDKWSKIQVIDLAQLQNTPT